MPKVIEKIRHIIPLSGKDSLCTAIVQQTKEPDLPYEYLFIDVEMELPETYAWLTSVEKSLGIKLTRVGESLQDLIEDEGYLPSHQRRYCTRRAKIHPLRDFVGKTKSIQYVGIRADESSRVADMAQTEYLQNKYPLIEAGICLETVYEILESKGLLPPQFFWQRLYDRVYELCGPVSRKWLETAPVWVRSSLFSWRSRSNCFMCFYQRLYEWVGLLEHHPELFERAEKLEFDYGSTQSAVRFNGENRGDGKDFSLNSGWFLSEIRKSAEGLLTKRVHQVHDAVVRTRHLQDDEGLRSVSCGIYCGK